MDRDVHVGVHVDGHERVEVDHGAEYRGAAPARVRPLLAARGHRRWPLPAQSLRAQLLAMLCAMELGIATFADLSADISPQERMRNLMEEAQLADELGLDVFAIGEHHRQDF